MVHAMRLFNIGFAVANFEDLSGRGDNLDETFGLSFEPVR